VVCLHSYDFAGYRILSFPEDSKDNLQEISRVLIPHVNKVVDDWIDLQYKAWIPHGFEKEELRRIFADMFLGILNRLKEREPEVCVDELELIGADLANRNFHYEALLISIHFLEESFLPYLIKHESKNKTEWLVCIDEFFHVALAAIATSYFEVYRKRLLEDVETGLIVQKSLLPTIPNSILDLDVRHIYEPALKKGKVGGDVIDVFLIDNDGVAFIVGDLSGHGTEAAAESVMLRSLFRNYMREGLSLSDAIARLNKALIRELEDEKFATALAGIYDGHGLIQMVNAGHPKPIIYTTDCREVEIDGMALAIDENAEYSVTSVELPVGGVFVAYTDGLTEARRNGEFFGDKRVTDIVRQMKGSSARAITDKLSDEVVRYSAGILSDDVAVLVLRRYRENECQLKVD
jgi:hypothetical protein